MIFVSKKVNISLNEAVNYDKTVLNKKRNKWIRVERINLDGQERIILEEYKC